VLAWPLVWASSSTIIKYTRGGIGINRPVYVMQLPVELEVKIAKERKLILSKTGLWRCWKFNWKRSEVIMTRQKIKF
jgi:hypothetical protein